MGKDYYKILGVPKDAGVCGCGGVRRRAPVKGTAAHDDNASLPLPLPLPPPSPPSGRSLQTRQP